MLWLRAPQFSGSDFGSNQMGDGGFIFQLRNAMRTLSGFDLSFLAHKNSLFKTSLGTHGTMNFDKSNNQGNLIRYFSQKKLDIRSTENQY